MTLELKQKIFALYWGQEVKWATDLSIEKWTLLDKVNGSHIHDKSCLVLTPLSQITDEDAIEGIKLNYDNPLLDEIISIERSPDFVTVRCKTFTYRTIYSYHHWATSPYKLRQPDCDYLRSKGYALPAFGFTVEQLVEAGVYKLREDGNKI